MKGASLLVAAGAVLLAARCGTVLDPGRLAMKQAAPFKVASVWEPTTSRPSRQAIEQVQRIGRDRFVQRMYGLLPYPMAIHAIGWFGDVWDLHAIAPYLRSDDADTRMVALAAFSRLNGVAFAGEPDAIKWWERNRETIPPPRGAGRKK